MIKHIGRHNNKKVVVLFREVPDEAHMCLVVYSETLPAKYHDVIMPILESAVGQNAEPFADALHRNLLQDGRNILGSLHHEGFIKKVPCSQVIITPTPASQVRLDELNNILNEMQKGQEAVKKMAELDANRGMKGTNKNASNDIADALNTYAQANPESVLDDSSIAQSYIAQAEKMERESASLLAEAGRLREEAKNLLPEVQEAKTTKTKAAAKTTRTRRASNGKKAEAQG
jgi:hypothetical protein